jgi:hypothetical protein
MGHGADSGGALLWEHRDLFTFLVEGGGFTGPQQIDAGLAYHRPGLHIEIEFLDGREPAVTTTLWTPTPQGRRSARAALGCLYVAYGCGPLQDVPETAPTRRTAAKRAHQHAAALQRVLPHLAASNLDQLIHRCRQGRLLPAD